MYRDSTGQSRQRSRVFQKRTWLTNLLSLGAGVTVSVVGSVAHSYDGVTLPTRVDSDNPVVRSNPFVSSQNGPVVSSEGLIRQTSDLQLSELQLKSIGTAVGLVPIGNPRPTQPVLEVSRPSQAKIRVNPLATKPANSFDLPVIGMVEDLSVMPSAVEPVATKTTEIVQQSRTRLLGLKYVESEIPDVLPTTPVTTEATPREQTTAAPELAIAVPDPVAKPAETVEASSDEDESVGVSFSFSDLADDDSGTGLDTATNAETLDSQPESEIIDLADQLLIPPPSEALIQSSEALIQSSEALIQSSEALIQSSEAPIQRESVALGRTVESDAREHGDEGVIDLLPLLPTPNPAWTEHTNTDSSLAAIKSNVIRYPDRHRAHVEVAAPPMISFQPESNQDSKDAARVDSTRIVPAKLAGFRVKSAQVPESSSTDEREVLTEQKPVGPIAVLNAKIRKSYSTARLQISEVKGKMLVRGVCATQEDATEVIRMIRNEFLVPVDDQIVIR